MSTVSRNTLISLSLALALTILGIIAASAWEKINSGSITGCSADTPGGCAHIENFCATIGGAHECYRHRTPVSEER